MDKKFVVIHRDVLETHQIRCRWFLRNQLRDRHDYHNDLNRKYLSPIPVIRLV